MTPESIYLGISLLGKSFCKDLDKVKTDVKLLLDIVFFFHIKSLCTHNLPYNSSEGSKFKVTFTKNKMKAKWQIFIIEQILILINYISVMQR